MYLVNYISRTSKLTTFLQFPYYLKKLNTQRKRFFVRNVSFYFPPTGTKADFVQVIMQPVRDWMLCNKLSLNVDKTIFIIFQKRKGRIGIWIEYKKSIGKNRQYKVFRHHHRRKAEFKKPIKIMPQKA